MFEKKNPKENHLSAEKALMTENGFGMHFPRIYLKVADFEGSLPHPVSFYPESQFRKLLMSKSNFQT
jgi:hypothetical protein